MMFDMHGFSLCYSPSDLDAGNVTRIALVQPSSLS